ncbi:TIGR02449 family protein [Oceanicoccus sp. KOV_DT_Chl]|uniref:TIGR02449 family protein n=1 Tax=Oceanicoccus sp. KOV_DT_Chl TaxID=1904639 RepID=UPI000C79F555|nr:TIGR02449 family protein [Oceanicoccus sp. KOV_DT_Chl]
MADKQLKTLAAKVNDLIQLCELLDKENRDLKTQASDWAEERVQLVEKTEVARKKLESMISRLKTLEQES